MHFEFLLIAFHLKIKLFLQFLFWLLPFLQNYLQKEPVDKIIVGLPRQMNGQESDNMKNITPFVNRMRKLYPQLPIEFYDERFTSVLAHKAMLESGIGKKARQNKALGDEISATIILQSYMESVNFWYRIWFNK